MVTVASEETDWEGEVLEEFRHNEKSFIPKYGQGSGPLVPVLWDLPQDLNRVSCCRVSDRALDRGRNQPECATDAPSDLGTDHFSFLELHFVISKMKSGLDNHSGHLQPHHSDLNHREVRAHAFG